MKKELSSVKILNLILCVVILLSFVYLITPKANASSLTSDQGEVIPLTKPVGDNDSEYVCLYEPDKNIEYYLQYYKEEISFFSKLYDYDLDEVISDIKNKNKNGNVNEYNIGNINDINYNNFEHGLIKYFEDTIKHNSLKRKVEYRKYKGDSQYIEDLIIYFSNIYENVDYKLMLAIGAAESGYYKVDYMISKNNIFGGMSSGRLIKYNNIEYGVLRYIKLLSENYYDKGLNTLYSIGYVYCPTNINGKKVASPHWINLVNRAYTYYNSYNNNVTIN